MARRRFFVDSVRNSQAVLSGSDARHLRQVLRAEVGQRYELSDNRSVYLAEVEGFGREQVRFRIIEELPPEPPALSITVGVSLIRFERLEWVLEKATELGAARIVPIISARSEKGLEHAAVKRLERWRRIVREASQQARRVRLPDVVSPVGFDEAVAADGFRLFLDEDRAARPILAALPGPEPPSGGVWLLAGPEGGWTDEERQKAVGSGWTPVSLGSNILRAETAALSALAVLAAAWNARGCHPEPVL